MDLDIEEINVENLEINDPFSDLMSLDESILGPFEVFERVIATNDIDLGIRLCEPYVDKSLYHSVLRACFVLCDAGLTYDQESIQRASAAVEHTQNFCNRIRKSGIFETVSKMIRTPNYDNYSDMELHAQLAYSMFLALSVGLTILENPNIVNLIRIVYRLRQCMYAYKECRTIFKRRTKWESETSRLHFEANIRLGHGITHLAISHIPPKILRIVNFFGYKGVRSKGFQEINKTAFELPGVSSRLAQWILLGYWMYGEPHGCLGPQDLTLCEKIVKQELKKFPDSLIYRGATAKLEQLRGNIDSAIEIFTELSNNPFEKTHKGFHAELCGCYALKCDWTECVKYATLLRSETTYTPACATYLEAIFRYIKSQEDCDDNLKDEATLLFELVPSLRIRYLGKTLTPEKVALDHSIRYFKNNKFIILPEMEMVYHGNGLYFIENNPTLLDNFMRRVDKQVQYYKKDLEQCDYVDNYLVSLFYKGVIYKHMRQYSDALDCLSAVLNEEARIENSFEIPPQAVMEIGLVQLKLGNHEQSKEWLEKALRDYSGYYTEDVVHIRVYAAYRELGISTDKQKESKTQLDEYAMTWLKEQGVDESNLKELIKNDLQLILP